VIYKKLQFHLAILLEKKISPPFSKSSQNGKISPNLVKLKQCDKIERNFTIISEAAKFLTDLHTPLRWAISLTKIIVGQLKMRQTSKNSVPSERLINFSTPRSVVYI